MTVFFSSPHLLGSQPGPSRPFTRLANAFSDHYRNEVHICDPNTLPHLGPMDAFCEAKGAAFDDAAAWTLRDAPTHQYDDGFVGGGGASLNQMRVVSKDHGGKTTTLWFSSHWAHTQQILTAEYSKFNQQWSPINPYVAWRASVEQEESDRLIVPSEFCRTTYPDVLREKTSVAEFGVDSEYYRPNPQRVRTERLQLLFPATNPVRKGLRQVLQVINIPHEKWALTMTGGAQLNLAALSQDRLPILMPGWVTDEQMRVFYQGHDVLLLPSLEEGQALAGLEAAACGLPLIVTPNAGLPIEDGKQGLVVPAQDGKQVQDAIQYFIDNPAEVTRMGREARAWAEKRPWERFGERVIEIVEG